MVYISKSVAIRGGYTTAFTDPPDPEANPTTLDAQGQGRVLLIAGSISPTIEGLRITGGDAAGLGGFSWEAEPGNAGGGVYVITATATISDNQVFGNSTDGPGGGLLLWYSDATVSDNIISNNTADVSGGVLSWGSAPTFIGNIIANNTSQHSAGGLHVVYSDATVSGNTVSGNTSGTYGGGLYLYRSTATVSGNTISANTASYGGGVRLWDTDDTLINNFVADNRATHLGSGLWINSGSSPRLLHNTVARNTGGDGSGIYVTDSSAVELTNTILVGHRVGIYVAFGSRADLEGTLLGSGTWANTTNWSGPGTINHSEDHTGDPAFVDPAAGDYHIGPGSAALDAGADAGVSTDIDGDPRPAGMGFDIGADEYYYPALEVAKQATPDPVQPGAPLTYTVYITNVGNVDLDATITDTLPLPVTLDEASGGTLALPGGTLIPPDGTVVLPDGRLAVTWTAVITKPGGVWMGTIRVTVNEDAEGPLTNLVEVTTKEGATGTDSVTVSAGWYVYLPTVMRNF